MTKGRSSRQLWKERLDLQLEGGQQLFFHMQETQIFPILLPNGSYTPYYNAFCQGWQSTAQGMVRNPPPPLLLHSQKFCRVLEHTGLVTCVPRGSWEGKIQRELKEKRRKSFQSDSSKFCQEFILHLWLWAALVNSKSQPCPWNA